MSNRQRIIAISAIIVLLLLAIVIPQTLFTVDERQLAVVVRFGEPVAVYGEKDTGLHVKTPFIDKVRYLPRTYQFWSGAEGEILANLPTADGNKLEITPWAIWRITDAEQFVRTMVTVEAGEHRVKEYVRSGVRDEITRNDLSEVVRSDTQRVLKYPIQAALPAITDEPGDRPAEDNGVTSKSPGQERRAEKIRIGRKKIVELIDEAVARRLLLADEKDGQGSRGIELVDLGIAKVDFVDTVREAAFNRLI
ncbi:MAG: SPFH domain-containing protein, partial [Thermoguttaceae bacterium]